MTTNQIFLHWRDLAPSPLNRLVRGEIDDDAPDIAYDREQKTISEQLKRLRQALTAHKARFKDNGQFSHVGELNEVSRELESLIGFLKSSTP